MAAPGAKSILRIGLRTLGGVPTAELKEKGSGESAPQPIETLRFSLQGDGKVIYGLYELLMNDVVQVELRPGGGAAGAPIVLPPLRPVGFEREESLLPHSDRSFEGYRLLQEYFAFPEKYLFFDVSGLERLTTASYLQAFDVVFSLRREFPQEKAVSAQVFRLHCTPIVNLFSHVAEPIRVTHLQSEYRVIPDVGRQTAMEVYSVDEVSSTRPDLEKPILYEPFYSIRHAAAGEEAKTFWHASRRSSARKDDEGTEVFLTLVDLGFRPSVPDVETVTVRVTCSNRDLPARLPFGSSTGGADFELEGSGVFTGIRCLRKPTGSLRTPLRRGTQWRLISHLSLNFLSLAESEGRGPEALQEILKLYDFADSSATRQQIAGITRLAARRILRPGRLGVGRLRARDRGLGGVRRDPVHRSGSVSVRFGPGAVLRAVRLDQLVLAAHRVHAPARGDPEALVAPRGGAVRPLRTQLLSEGHRFEFFQAVRLLERLEPEREPVGREGPPSSEVARFRVRVSLEFPASQIHEVRESAAGQAELTVAFFGMTGPLGVLPHPYTELLLERVRRQDRALLDFLDLFHHRFLSFFYRAWEKYRFPIAYERSRKDPFTEYLFDLIGMGTPGLSGRLAVPDQRLLLYAGLIAQKPHSASAITSILRHHFGVPVKLEQFSSQWLALDPEYHARVGVANSGLGRDLVCGERVRNVQSKFRVRLGPMRLPQYLSFLPGSPSFAEVADLTRFLAGMEFDFDVQLVLAAAEVPRCFLSEDAKALPRLGWTTWLTTRPVDEDASPVVLPVAN